MALINSSNFSGGNDGWELNYLSGWIKHATFNVTLWISGSGASATVASFGSLGCYYRNETPDSADQRIAADMIFADFGTQAGNSAWVAGRIDTAANTMYRAGKVDGYWHIQKVVAGTVTTIGTPVADFVSNTTQRVTLEIINVGANVELKLYKNAATTPITSGIDSSSPITAVGKVGLLALTGNIKLDNFQADTIEASGATTTISATLGNITGSVASVSAPKAAISATLANVTGSLSSGSGSLVTTITATLGNVVGSIASTGSTANGTFTSEVLKDYAGNVLANTALNFVRLYNDTTGALVLSKTGVSTNGSGIVTFSDTALVAGTTYRVDWETAAGSRRMPRKATT